VGQVLKLLLAQVLMVLIIEVVEEEVVVEPT